MNRLKLKIIFFTHWPIIIITAISFLLPAIWLKDGMGIGYVETGLFFLIEPFKLLETSAYTWTDIGLGTINSSLQPSLFFLATGLVSLLGFSLVAIQYLTFSIILLISSLAIYLIAKELFKDFRNPKLIALFSSLSYILNPFTMNVWRRYVSSIFILPLLPLLFLIIIKLFKKPSFKYSFYFALAVLLFSINAVNPAFFIPVFIPIIIYAVYEIIRVKDLRLSKLKYIGIAIVLTIFMNLWWLINSILSFNQIYNSVGLSASPINIRSAKTESGTGFMKVTAPPIRTTGWFSSLSWMLKEIPRR